MSIKETRDYDPISRCWIPKSNPEMKYFARKFMAEEFYQKAQPKIYKDRTSYEDIWYEGKIIRSNVHNQESFVQEIAQEFPELDFSNYLFAGNTDGTHRPSYKGEYAAIAFDDVESLPSWHKFPESVLPYWARNYALKINRNTREVWCKALIGARGWEVSFDKEVPQHQGIAVHSLGLLCTKDSYIEGNYDVYFLGFPDDVLDWCKSVDIRYPCPRNYQPWVYSAVYEDYKLIGIKAYIEYGYN